MVSFPITLIILAWFYGFWFYFSLFWIEKFRHWNKILQNFSIVGIAQSAPRSYHKHHHNNNHHNNNVHKRFFDSFSDRPDPSFATSRQGPGGPHITSEDSLDDMPNTAGPNPSIFGGFPENDVWGNFELPNPETIDRLKLALKMSHHRPSYAGEFRW